MATNGEDNYSMNFKESNGKGGIPDYIGKVSAQDTLRKGFFGNVENFSNSNVISDVNTVLEITEKTAKINKDSGDARLRDYAKEQAQLKKIKDTREELEKKREISSTKAIKMALEEQKILKKIANQSLKDMERAYERMGDKRTKIARELKKEIDETAYRIEKFTDDMEDTAEKLSQLSKSIESGPKTVFGAMGNSLDNIGKELQGLTNMFNLQAAANNSFEKSAQDKIQVMNALQKQFNLTENEFVQVQQSMNSTLKSLNSGKSLYNNSDMSTYMQNLSQLGIYSTDLAQQQMSSSIVATKYLGASNQTQQEIFKYIKRTNDYSMLDKHNKTITSILKQQLGVSTDQLDALTQLAQSTENSTYAAGMSDTARERFKTESTVLGATLTNALGSESDATSIMNLLNTMVGASNETMAQLAHQYGIDPSVIMQLQNTGDARTALNSILSSGYFAQNAGSVASNRTLQDSLGTNPDTLSALKSLATSDQNWNINTLNALDDIANGTSTIEDYIENTTTVTAAEGIQNWLSVTFGGIPWKYSVNLANAAFGAILASNVFTGIDKLTSILGGSSGATGVAGATSILGTLGTMSVALAGISLLVSGIATSLGSSKSLDAAETSAKKLQNMGILGRTWNFLSSSAAQGTGYLGTIASKGVRNSKAGKIANKASELLTGESLNNAFNISELKSLWLAESATLNKETDVQKRKNSLLAWYMLMDNSDLLDTFGINETHSSIANSYNSLGSYDKSEVQRIGEYQKGWFYNLDGWKGDIDWGNYHKNGLNFVPRDNYKALLHKGEMVLRADQANDYRNLVGIGGETVNDYPRYSSGKLHTGHDMAFSKGTPVGSAVAGTVITSEDLIGNQSEGYRSYGRYIMVQGDDGLQYLYGHLSERNAQVGDRVYAGQLLGLSGNTGNSTGPHLHFEVRRNGQHINPEPYITDYIRNVSSVPTSSSATGVIGDNISTVPFSTKRYVPNSLNNNLGGVGGAEKITGSVDSGFNRLIGYLENIRAEQENQRSMIEAFSNII